MCGIAGIIYRDGAHEIGSDMTRMLQSMKHRGPDSTGYALYGRPNHALVMRYTLADANTPRDFEFDDRLARHQAEVLALGHSLEIVKDLGDAESGADQYDLGGFNGTHAIGHVRMATESDVDIS